VTRGRVKTGVPTPVTNGNDSPSRWGYLAAILASALGHIALIIVLFVILPEFFKAPTPPPAYTVKIVDSLPAGDLGTHLPRLGTEQKAPHQKRDTSQETKPTPPPQQPSEEDSTAIVLNTIHKSPTPTPTPTPSETSTPSPAPQPTATATPTPRPKRTPRQTPAPKPTSTPRRSEHHKPKPTPAPELVRVQPTPNVRQKLEKVREQLLAEHLRQMKKHVGENEADQTSRARNGGPAVAKATSEGSGYGVGSGSGSLGIQQDTEFLLYYEEVQKKIKEAFTFPRTDPNLNATVTFGINPDGSLNSARVTASSKDPLFDDAVVRAIRRAAPFSPPPARYSQQFAQGVEAVFKLGELSS